MKPAGNDTRIIRANDGSIWGVFLAGNSCAEHENGINSILHRLRIDSKGRRLEGRTMTAPVTFSRAKGQVTRTYYLDVPKATKKTSQVAYLGLDEFSLEDSKRRIYGLDRYKLDTDITGAWDDREFKLAGWTDDGKTALDALEAAAAEADLAVWIGNTPDLVNNPFSRSGMIIAIASKMPQEAKDALNESDDEAQRLKDAADATGIRERIEEQAQRLSSWSSGPAFHALAPSWKLKSVGRNGETVELKTKHPVVFFLNPARQKEFNHGWFTVEELEQWLEGKGPVIKQAA